MNSGWYRWPGWSGSPDPEWASPEDRLFNCPALARPPRARRAFFVPAGRYAGAMTVKIKRSDAAFVIRDENGRALAYVYFYTDDIRRGIMNGMTEAEAMEVAKTIARALSVR